MMTDEMKKAVREMISEYMEGAESETEKLMEKVACALAERMDVSALEKHAVHEVGQMLDYYGMENVEGVFHEFYELKIVMCALRKHFPEGMTHRICREAVEEYAKKFGVE